ncbi:hypothetical protein DXG01_000451 [Tephrocybe rancida]|nr:hypothetical protein DXG01_000451 [Tephrocybe rancida]
MSTFTPTNSIDMTKERGWPAELGMLDWDSTNIVFTKRSLIEFLKYTGTTVDPNFTNIAKLPRYAKFGKISEDAPAVVSTGEAPTLPASTSISADDFKPTRRVRTVPGRPHSDIFGASIEDDALASAPPMNPAPAPAAVAAASAQETPDESGIDFGSSFKPSRFGPLTYFALSLDMNLLIGVSGPPQAAPAAWQTFGMLQSLKSLNPPEGIQSFFRTF